MKIVYIYEGFNYKDYTTLINIRRHTIILKI